MRFARVERFGSRNPRRPLDSLIASSSPPRLGCEARDSLKVFRIPGHHPEAMLEGRCTDPDVFDSDRLPSSLECGEQVPGTDGFRLAHRKNVDAAQNLAGNSLPQKRSMGDASCSVT